MPIKKPTLLLKNVSICSLEFFLGLEISIIFVEFVPMISRHGRKVGFHMFLILKSIFTKTTMYIIKAFLCQSLSVYYS